MSITLAGIRGIRGTSVDMKLVSAPGKRNLVEIWFSSPDKAKQVQGRIQAIGYPGLKMVLMVHGKGKLNNGASLTITLPMKDKDIAGHIFASLAR
jgi:hypothetical protein